MSSAESGGRVEHALEDGLVLRPVGAVAELAAMSTALTVATALMR